MNNSEGGATYFSDCQVELRGKNMFVVNKAGNKGAGIHTSLTDLARNQLICKEFSKVRRWNPI